MNDCSMVDSLADYATGPATGKISFFSLSFQVASSFACIFGFESTVFS